MTQTEIKSRMAMPEDMRFLLRDYPRDAWPDHPNFARSIKNWMGAHQMFRELARITRDETEAYLAKDRPAEAYADSLAFHGDLLVRNLHGHHGWEDRSFFPELKGADGRFERGLDMLENDHLALDDVLDRFTRRANRVVKLTQLDQAQALEEAGSFHESALEIGSLLKRHLTDEEDLVVPILLHHRLRG
jgi:hypothetical protein